MGLCEVLTIIFVLCKLFGVITWSWWLVFLPEIIAVATYILIWVFSVISVIKANKQINKLFFKK
ncbi:MAG: hypothetical protein V8S74_06320 [Lachnospirales bacterium]